MKYADSVKLLSIAEKIEENAKLKPSEVSYLLKFKHLESDPFFVTLLKNITLPLSLLLGFFFSVYPEYFEGFVKTSPQWTNIPPRILAGVDYIWDILGEPVGKANIIFHLPNIVLYSFGILGVKKLFDALNRKNWIDQVLEGQRKLKDLIDGGKLKLSLQNGNSVLFIGKGDFIATQFVLDHKDDQVVVISEIKPSYTDIWNYYDLNTGYEDLKKVLKRVAGDSTGEYLFFPVKDDQIFLPSESAFDLPPHKLDIICQDLRNIERRLKWKPKRIIIIGDKYHQSFVRSEDKKNIIKGSSDVISLQTISLRFGNVTLIDPTDIVLKKVLKIAAGRKVVFRATREGIREYKKRFYKRIEELGYKPSKKEGILTIGYDLFEDQTEQQTLSRKVDDYFPVVLSKGVYDALIRNGYKKSEFLYVPELVLSYLKKEASEQ